MIVLTPEDNKRLLNLCGKYDEHIHLIADRLEVDIKQRGYTFAVSGNPAAVDTACQTLTYLYNHQTDRKAILAPEQVHRYFAEHAEINRCISSGHSHQQAVITARGKNQINYIHNIMKHDINFGIGPAGTGKTYLAVACAVNALEMERVSRSSWCALLLKREKNWDFYQEILRKKFHPYLRPLYDALHDMLGFEFDSTTC